MAVDFWITPTEVAFHCWEQVVSVARILEERPVRYQVHGTGSTVEGEIRDSLNAVDGYWQELRKGSSRTLIGLCVDTR